MTNCLFLKIFLKIWYKMVSYLVSRILVIIIRGIYTVILTAFIEIIKYLLLFYREQRSYDAAVFCFHTAKSPESASSYKLE